MAFDREVTVTTLYWCEDLLILPSTSTEIEVNLEGMYRLVSVKEVAVPPQFTGHHK